MDVNVTKRVHVYILLTVDMWIFVPTPSGWKKAHYIERFPPFFFGLPPLKTTNE